MAKTPLQIRAIESATRILLAPLFIRIATAGSQQERQVQFHLGSEFLSAWPFRFGTLARRIYYQRTLARCGSNPLIRMGAVFVYPEAILGDNILVGNRCVIGLAEIGSDVLLAHHVSILSGRHHHSLAGAGPRRAGEGQLSKVTVGSNVWIGANATVMADVGDNAIVGAGAVVVQPVPEGRMAVGNPARLVEKDKL